jgi:hypothetical protein
MFNEAKIADADDLRQNNAMSALRAEIVDLAGRRV